LLTTSPLLWPLRLGAVPRRRGIRRLYRSISVPHTPVPVMLHLRETLTWKHDGRKIRRKWPNAAPTIHHEKYMPMKPCRRFADRRRRRDLWATSLSAAQRSEVLDRRCREQPGSPLRRGDTSSPVV
jgi:hypothetical protein